MFTMRIDGGDELATRLNSLPEAVSKKVQVAALKEGGEPIRLAMAANAPRGDRTPHLADNISISVARSEDRDDDAFGVAVGPSKAVFWAGFQEFGTAHQPARPFARPAFDSKAPAALGIVGQRLWDALRKQSGTFSGPSPSGVGNL